MTRLRLTLLAVTLALVAVVTACGFGFQPVGTMTGSCDQRANSTETSSLCADFTYTYGYMNDVKNNCVEGVWSPSTPCPNAGKIGGCNGIVTGTDSDVTTTTWFYPSTVSPMSITVAEIQIVCSTIKYQFVPAPPQ